MARNDAASILASDLARTAIWEAAMRGDAPALGAVLAQVQPRVQRAAASVCRNPADAEEVVQETLLALARGIGGLDDPDAVGRWLETVARRACTKQRERGGAVPAGTLWLDDDEATRAELVDPAPSVEHEAAHAELAAAVDEAIARLAPAYRSVLELRDVEGLTAPEVAEALGISVDAVKSRLHRARLAVRAAVEPWLTDPAAPPAKAPAPPDCPDILALRSAHREGDVPADLCAQLEAHVARCPTCAARCASLERVLVACRDRPQRRISAPG